MRTTDEFCKTIRVRSKSLKELPLGLKSENMLDIWVSFFDIMTIEIQLKGFSSLYYRLIVE